MWGGLGGSQSREGRCRRNNKETTKQASTQATNKQASMQANKQANKHTSQSKPCFSDAQAHVCTSFSGRPPPRRIFCPHTKNQSWEIDTSPQRFVSVWAPQTSSTTYYIIVLYTLQFHFWFHQVVTWVSNFVPPLVCVSKSQAKDSAKCTLILRNGGGLWVIWCPTGQAELVEQVEPISCFRWHASGLEGLLRHQQAMAHVTSELPVTSG